MAVWYAQNSTVNINSINEWNAAANGSGAWLDASNDGSLAALAAGDVLCANGKTAIALNVDSFTCGTIQTSGSANDAAGADGGGFTCDLGAGNNRSFTCDVLAGTTSCLTQSNSTKTFTLTGNVTGGDAPNVRGLVLSKTSTINGNVTGGSNGTAAYGVYSTAFGIGATISGDVTAAASPALAGSSSTWTIAGDAIAVGSVAAINIYSGTVTVVLGGSLVCSTTGGLPISMAAGTPILKMTGTATEGVKVRDGDLAEVTLSAGGGATVIVVRRQ